MSQYPTSMAHVCCYLTLFLHYYYYYSHSSLLRRGVSSGDFGESLNNSIIRIEAFPTTVHTCCSALCEQLEPGPTTTHISLYTSRTHTAPTKPTIQLARLQYLVLFKVVVLDNSSLDIFWKHVRLHPWKGSIPKHSDIKGRLCLWLSFCFCCFFWPSLRVKRIPTERQTTNYT